MKPAHYLSAIVTAIVILISGCNNETLTSVTSFDGVEVSFDNMGAGEPAIILVHGWSNTRAIWDDQLGHLAMLHQVIAVDLPGFGKSGNNREEWTMEAFGKDISAVMEQLKLENVILVGFSMGAPVVIEAAGNNPDKVKGVIIVDALQDVAVTMPPHVAHFMDSLMMDLITYPTKEKMVTHGFLRNNVDEAYDKIITMLEGASRKGWKELISGYIEWNNNEHTDAIQKVKAPIIAINSTNQPTNTEAFRKYSPSFEVKIIEDAGHALMLDRPEEFTRVLDESITELLNK